MGDVYVLSIDHILPFFVRDKLIYIHAGMSCIQLDQLVSITNLKYAEQYDSYLGNLESGLVCLVT